MTVVNDQLTKLKTLLRARKGKNAYRDSVKLIEAEIAAIEAGLSK